MKKNMYVAFVGNRHYLCETQDEAHGIVGLNTGYIKPIVVEEEPNFSLHIMNGDGKDIAEHNFQTLELAENWMTAWIKNLVDDNFKSRNYNLSIKNRKTGLGPGEKYNIEIRNNVVNDSILSSDGLVYITVKEA